MTYANVAYRMGWERFMNELIASGVSAGIDGALRVVERLFDKRTSERVAAILNYRIRTD